MMIFKRLMCRLYGHRPGMEEIGQNHYVNRCSRCRKIFFTRFSNMQQMGNIYGQRIED